MLWSCRLSFTEPLQALQFAFVLPLSKQLTYLLSLLAGFLLLDSVFIVLLF